MVQAWLEVSHQNFVVLLHIRECFDSWNLCKIEFFSIQFFFEQSIQIDELKPFSIIQTELQFSILLSHQTN
jgi:hypothetical protein